MTPFEITLAVSVLILGGYAASGAVNFGKSRTYDAFFLNNRSLSPQNVRNTFTGAAISISTVLLFFLTLSPVFGWQIFLSPLTLAAGVLLFAHGVYPRLKARPTLIASLRGESSQPIDSLGDLVFHIYGKRWLSTAVTAVSALGIGCVLVAEMMVGVTIYSEYFVEPEWIVFLIAATLFLYAGLGGMRSVVQTDGWQVRLITASMVTIVAVLALQGTSTNPDITASDMWTGTWAPAMTMPAALMINMLLVNLCLLPSSLRVWQVVAGSSKGAGFKRSLWFSTGIISVILVSAVFVARGVAVRNPGANVDLELIFSFLVKNENGFVSYLVYPLFVAALLSALVSTADSAILPLAQVLSSRKNKWSSARVLRNVTLMLVIVIAIYFLVTRVLQFELVPWILTVLSVTTCIAPSIIVPLFVRPRRFSPQASLVVGVGVATGCVAAFAWSITFREISIQPWNCAIGTTISLAATLIACAMKEEAVA
ncbi:MAG: hypothetical protein AAF533_20505 [Acidobacteriota bacterium]